jgi:hypothetical protein
MMVAAFVRETEVEALTLGICRTLLPTQFCGGTARYAHNRTGSDGFVTAYHI